jgi:hypothetical protein
MRETKKIILPESNIVIEIYTYLSQKGYEAIRKPFIREKKVTFIQGKGVVNKEDQSISIEDMIEANNANIKYMLYSVDGITGTIDKLFDMVQDLRKKDYAFLVEEINKVTKEDDKIPEEEKTEEQKSEELKKKSEE